MNESEKEDVASTITYLAVIAIGIILLLIINKL